MRETFLEINLLNLQHNLKAFQSKIHSNTRILVNLKGNAYGMDAVIVGKYLEKLNPEYFSVAYINEGIKLRKNNIQTKLIVFNPSFDHFQELIDYQLEPEVSSLAFLQKLIDFFSQKNINNFPIHLKLDTGMHRAGIMNNELSSLISLLNNQNNVKLQSVFSHLAASEDESEDAFTFQQIALFNEMTKTLKNTTNHLFFRHLLNTAGVFRFPEAQFDMVRPGLGIYGFNLIESMKNELKPIARLKTKINQIKILQKGETVGYNRNFTADNYSKVALLPIGYADGISRKLGQSAYSVSINGKKAKIIGNVSMDTISIDVTHIDCKQGDEVVIFDDVNDVYEMAELLHTIPYEIITSITQRVPRRVKT